MTITFDGANKRIIIGAVGTYDAKVDLYSDWKEWVRTSDNAKFEPAFAVTGGDRSAPNFILRTDLGWRIRAPEANGQVTITGNLYPNADGDEFILPPVGAFTVLVSQQLSSLNAYAVWDHILSDGLAARTALAQAFAALLNNATIVSQENGSQAVTVFAADGSTPLITRTISADGNVRTST